MCSHPHRPRRLITPPSPRTCAQDASNSAVATSSPTFGDSFVDLGAASLGGVLSAATPGSPTPPGVSFAFALQLVSLPAQPNAAPAALVSFTNPSFSAALAVEITRAGQLRCYFNSTGGQLVRRGRRGSRSPPSLGLI